MGSHRAKRSSTGATHKRPLAPAPAVPSRTRRRAVQIAAIAVAAAWAAVDHGRLNGEGGDDWARLDHRAVTVLDGSAGGELRVQPARGSPVAVRLVGLYVPAGAEPSARRFLAGRAAAGSRVTLLLDGPATRDAAGRVRAYAYAADGTCLNVELVRAGWAKADRREPTPFAGLIGPAEAEARKRKRGVWAVQTKNADGGGTFDGGG